MISNDKLEEKLKEEATLKILDNMLSAFFKEANLNEILKDTDTLDDLQISTISQVVAARLSGCCYYAPAGGMVCPCRRG